MPDLFDFLPAAAATGDPVTSFEAARELERSGERKRQVQEAAAAVRRFPGMTSLELAGVTGIDRHRLGRRLPDAEKLGLVRQGEARPCAMAGGRRRAVTWWPADPPKGALR